MPHKPPHPSITLPVALAITIVVLITLAILVLPLETQYRLYVDVGQDTIIDISTQTTKVPIISTWFPSSNPFGVYTIEVQVQNVSTFQNISAPQFLHNVPIGQYTFILQNITAGFPYAITVILIKNNATIASFPITATF